MNVLLFGRDSQKIEYLALALKLRWPDLKPQVTSRGAVGLQTIERGNLDLVVLCEDLPDMGVFSIIEEVRRFSSIPLIVVAERPNETDLIKALELGADDFVRLPCSLTEVMVRVVAVLRRAGLVNQRRHTEGSISCGDLVINAETYEVFVNNCRILLTPTEFKLLHLLAKNRNMTLSQDFIQQTIWPEDVLVRDALKKYIQRLRQKLGDRASAPTRIVNVRGLGYRLLESQETSRQAAPAMVAAVAAA